MVVNLHIHEVRERTPQLLAVWEASVRATHHFLSDAEIARIKTYVPQAMRGAAHLTVAENEQGRVIAFMGTENGRLEMLFVSPEERGRGVGKRLLQYGIRHDGVREVTANEQNPQAIGFYRHMGFAADRRTDCDEEGSPYPLLYMKLARLPVI